jgi:hypothetical protein
MVAASFSSAAVPEDAAASAHLPVMPPPPALRLVLLQILLSALGRALAGVGQCRHPSHLLPFLPSCFWSSLVWQKYKKQKAFSSLFFFFSLTKLFSLFSAGVLFITVERSRVDDLMVLVM